MGTEDEGSKKRSQPQLVKLDKGFKLAEQWINNMSKSKVDEKSTETELEGRPSRLGIGATVPRGSRVINSSCPVERKLLAKLDSEKRKTMRAEEFVPSSKEGNVAEDSEEDDELESKTKAFSKKRPLNMTSSPLLMKKKKK